MPNQSTATGSASAAPKPGAVPAPCRFLDWDSAFFGRRIATVTAEPRDAAALQAINAWCRAERIDCLYCLLPASQWAAVRLVEAGRFRLVDVRVTFGWLPTKSPPAGGDSNVRPVQPGDIDRLCAIAGNIHQMTRFYNDPGFPRDRCAALYETWIRSSCEGRADAVFVYAPTGAASGYLTCHFDPGRRGRIGLVGLAPEVRRQGGAGQLVRAAQRWFADHDAALVTVVSQGGNRAAQRTYERCGFLNDDTALWFHRWFAGPSGATGTK